MKTLIAIAVIATLLLSSGAALAKGPAPKATGEVGIPVNGWYAEFSAYYVGTKVVGGQTLHIGKGSMRRWSDVVGQDLRYDVKYVRVNSNRVWFAAKCTYDTGNTYVGKWLFVKVDDGGTPGRKGDYIGWDWNSGTNEADAAKRVRIYGSPANWWPVIDGNLVVH